MRMVRGRWELEAEWLKNHRHLSILFRSPASDRTAWRQFFVIYDGFRWCRKGFWRSGGRFSGLSWRHNWPDSSITVSYLRKKRTKED